MTNETGNRETQADSPGTQEQEASQGSVEEEAQKSQQELRRDVEETREELGETVDALSEKADVPAQARSAVDEQKERFRAKQEDFKQKVSSVGGGAGGNAGEQAKSILNQLAARASEQPLPYLGGAVAVGLVLGLALRGRSS